jgi:hypothetical protein
VTAGFYLAPVNKGLGSTAAGQMCLVENNARSLDGHSVYEWKATSSYGNVTNNQRNAKCISQRIEKTLSEMDFKSTTAFFDKINHEYYIVSGGTASFTIRRRTSGISTRISR